MAASNRLNIRLLRGRSPQQNLRLGLTIQLGAAAGLVLVVASGLESLWTMVPLIMVFAGTIGLVAPNAISSLLDHFHHMSATAAALQGSIQFSCGALAGVLVGAFELDSAWPMVGTMLGAALIGNIGLRLLAGRAGHG
jgi:MFS transporter, DHA1 family, multidrug resistance protein